MFKNKIISIFILLILSSVFYSAEGVKGKVSGRYFTDERGNILMNVNVWGHINNPGIHLVNEGIDFPTLLSIVGGPKPGAKLSKIKLIREVQDGNNKILYEIDLNDFYKTGIREGFVDILPNDTIIIDENTISYLLSKVNILNSFLQMLNIYLQINLNN